MCHLLTIVIHLLCHCFTLFTTLLLLYHCLTIVIILFYHCFTTVYVLPLLFYCCITVLSHWYHCFTTVFRKYYDNGLAVYLFITHLQLLYHWFTTGLPHLYHYCTSIVPLFYYYFLGFYSINLTMCLAKYSMLQLSYSFLLELSSQLWRKEIIKLIAVFACFLVFSHEETSKNGGEFYSFSIIKVDYS